MAKSTARYRAKLAAKWRKQRLRKRGLLKVTKPGGRMKASGRLSRRANRKLSALK
jgi:hypothetical protein